MQIVDHWVGVPLCFVFSIWRFFEDLINHPRIRKAPRKILIMELSEMGTTVAAFSAIKKAQEIVQESFGRNNHKDGVYFLTFNRNREVIEILDVIPKENILTIDDSSFASFVKSIWTTLKNIRMLEIDITIDWELFSRFTALFGFLIGAPERIGFDNYTAEGLYRGHLLTKKVLYNPYLHIGMNLLNTVDAISVDAKEEPLLKKKASVITEDLPTFRPTNESMQRIRQLLPPDFIDKKIIIISPDPGVLPIRGWPIENYIELIKKLIQENQDILIILTGLESSRPLSQRIISSVGSKKLVDFIGKTKSLYDFITLLSDSDVLITNDGGPAHFAALTEIRSIVFFGPETPLIYRPIGNRTKVLYTSLSCSPCFSASNHRRSKCNNNICLQAITVDMAYHAVKEAIEC